jgi:DNA polymerase-3 subunit gamma/tau
LSSENGKYCQCVEFSDITRHGGRWRGKVVNREQVAVVGNQSTVSSNQGTANNNQFAVTNNQSPITNSQVPVTNTQPTAVIPPIVNIGKLRSTSTIGKPLAQQEVVQEVVRVQESAIQQDKVFSFDELQTAWNRFTNDLQMENRMTEYVIFNRKFTLKGTVIHLEVDNEIQLEKVSGTLRNEMITYLRKSLQNSKVQLETTVMEQENQSLIYTQADKFRFLAEKNPALIELKNALGLDYDY